MTAYKRRDIRIRIGTTAEAAAYDNYTTLSGICSSMIACNRENVDITNNDSGGARKLLAGAGGKSMTITGTGNFTDSTSWTTINTAFDAQAHYNFEMLIPDFGSLRGKFAVTRLEYLGKRDGDVLYSVTLESSGDTMFTPV